MASLVIMVMWGSECCQPVSCPKRTAILRLIQLLSFFESIRTYHMWCLSLEQNNYQLQSLDLPHEMVLPPICCIPDRPCMPPMWRWHAWAWTCIRGIRCNRITTWRYGRS